MRSSTPKDLSVYDFDEHEESVEVLSGKNKPRFDPKRQKTGSEIDKHTFIQSFTSRLNLDPKDVAEVTCIDLSDRDNTPVTSHAVDSEDENPMLFEEKSESDEVIESSSNSHEHSQMSQDESEPDTLTGAYPLVMGTSGLVVSSIGNEQFAGPPSDETFVDVTSADGESLEYESGSPSTSASDLSENEGLLVDSPFYHPAFEDAYDDDMAVIVSPDYMLYGRTLYLESLFTFSSDCIRMECFDASGNFEKLVLEWRLDDIIQIDCCWCTSAEVATVKVHLSTAAVDETKKVNDYHDTVKLRFSVTGIQWLDKERKIQSLAPRYKDVWIAHSSDNSASEGDIPEDNMFISKHYFTEIGEPFEDVIYPKGDPDAVSISKRDIELLQPDTFINDTIIDFYMKYLKNKIPPGEKHRFHFFNSFFFRKLADLDKDPGSALQGRAAFLRVRKWTRKVNLFDKDYIFIPVNYNLHWSLLVICHPGHIDNVQDDVKESPEVPCILHMDSIKGNHSGLRTLIQSYLMEEWKERHQGSDEGILSKFSNLRYVELELPQQENSFDCGLFLLHYAELFLEEAPSNFCPLNITKFRPFLTANWFVPAEASLKRTIIRRLIYDLLKSPSLLFSGYPETDDKKEPAVQRCYEAKQNVSDSAHFVSDSRIEIKLLATTASGVVQCDKGLVLREFFESRAAAESSSAYSDHLFQQNIPSQKLDALRCPIEESTNLSEKLVVTGLDKADGQTVDAKQSEQICVTSYAAEGVDMESMQETEELAMDFLPGLSESGQMASIGKGITDFLQENCGFVPDSPVTPFGEKLESCVADFQKNNAGSSQCEASEGGDISKLDPGVHIDCTETEVGKNEHNQAVEGARGEDDAQNMDCIMANSENCPGTTTTDATSENCKRSNTSDTEGNGGQCQETGTVNGNCVPCVSGQSWQEIISSDEESAVDKDESGPQHKRRKLMASEGGRRHTRSSARRLLP